MRKVLSEFVKDWEPDGSEEVSVGVEPGVFREEECVPLMMATPAAMPPPMIARRISVIRTITPVLRFLCAVACGGRCPPAWPKEATPGFAGASVPSLRGASSSGVGRGDRFARSAVWMVDGKSGCAGSEDGWETNGDVWGRASGVSLDVSADSAASSRARAKAATLAKRSLGSLASAVITTCSTASGRSETRSRRGGGGVSTCWLAISKEVP